MRQIFAALVLAVVFANCGESPTRPSAPQSAASAGSTTASIESITIVPADDTMRIGEKRQFSLAVTLGPGAPPSGPMPAWSSTNSAVVGIDANGIAMGTALGEAVIRVLFRGHIATRQITVVP